MRLRIFVVALALVAFATAPALVQDRPSGGEGLKVVQPGVQEKGGEEETGQYDVVPNWPKPLPTHDAEWGFGVVSGVFAESPDRVFVTTRGDLPKKAQAGATRRQINFLLVFNRNGDMIENWSQWNSMMRQPHSVYESPYDPERRVWYIDNTLQQILVFSNDGKKLLMTLGEADKPGTDQTHFGGPADMAWLPDGTFFVADGYQNTRVVKFNKDGKYLMEWGTKGNGPGQLDFVHGISVDAQRRVLIADRRNSRIQIFDENGKFLDQWRGIRYPTKVVATVDGSVWVSDGTNNRILKYDRDGFLKYGWGTTGTFEGGLRDPHQFSVDQEGDLYIADYTNRRVQKFTPKKGADKSKLMTRSFGWPKS